MNRIMHTSEDALLHAADPLLHSGSLVISIFIVFTLSSVLLNIYLFSVITRLARENTRLVDLMSNMNERMFDTLSALTTRLELLPSELLRLVAK